MNSPLSVIRQRESSLETDTNRMRKSLSVHPCVAFPSDFLDRVRKKKSNNSENKEMGNVDTKIRSQSLSTIFHEAMSIKMLDVEELIDYYFHRRAAAIVTLVIAKLPFVITPNQITLIGLGLGWAAAAFLYDAEYHKPFNLERNHSLMAASILMLSWVIMDCADGQVARLCNRGTRTGRILDGLVDSAVVLSHHIVLGSCCSSRYHGQYMAIALFSNCCTAFHTLVYDKMKNVYMENTLPYSECSGETVESVNAEYKKAKADCLYSLDCFLLGFYVRYLKCQALFTSRNSITVEAAYQKFLADRDDEYRQWYRQQYGYLMRLAAHIGLSGHTFGLYVAYFIAIYHWDALFYIQMYIVVFLNIVTVCILIVYRNSSMASAASAYQLHHRKAH